MYPQGNHTKWMNNLKIAELSSSASLWPDFADYFTYSSSCNCKSTSGWGKFPKKLYDVVSEGAVAKWSTSGKSILIHEKTFENMVMLCHPGFVQASTFANLRRLFRQYLFDWCLVDSEEGIFEFKHPFFQRGRPEMLCKVLTRRKSSQHSCSYHNYDLTPNISRKRGRRRKIKKGQVGVKDASNSETQNSSDFVTSLDCHFQRPLLSRKRKHCGGLKASRPLKIDSFYLKSPLSETDPSYRSADIGATADCSSTYACAESAEMYVGNEQSTPRWSRDLLRIASVLAKNELNEPECLRLFVDTGGHQHVTLFSGDMSTSAQLTDAANDCTEKSVLSFKPLRAESTVSSGPSSSADRRCTEAPDYDPEHSTVDREAMTKHSAERGGETKADQKAIRNVQGDSVFCPFPGDSYCPNSDTDELSFNSGIDSGLLSNSVGHVLADVREDPAHVRLLPLKGRVSTSARKCIVSMQPTHENCISGDNPEAYYKMAVCQNQGGYREHSGLTTEELRYHCEGFTGQSARREVQWSEVHRFPLKKQETADLQSVPMGNQLKEGAFTFLSHQNDGHHDELGSMVCGDCGLPPFEGIAAKKIKCELEENDQQTMTDSCLYTELQPVLFEY